MRRPFVRCLLAVGAGVVLLAPAEARQAPSPSVVDQAAPPGEAATIQAPETVEVQAVVDDEAIAARLRRILDATEWFDEPAVTVDEGVVFLRGRAESEQYKRWAGDLARNTRDVVAVVNQMSVAQPSPFDFAPALVGLKDLWHNVVYWIPFALLALMILALTYLAAALAARGLRALLHRRIGVGLLREVLARGAAVVVFLVGLYIVLKISGLTRLALTVIGGTGLFGLVLGIAFRDIAENFLASILLSVQSPFRTGDLVEIAGFTGIVQQLNVRTTVLMSLDGNHLQLPNALVYKTTIRNFSANPNRREDFTVGVSYDTAIPQAQEIARRVLDVHPAVLETPDPWVLVDNLGPATVNLKIYFWLDGSRYSWLKVRSSVIRLVKRAFQDAGISMPDESREIVFPRGVPIQMEPAAAPTPSEPPPKLAEPPTIEPESVAVRGEDHLHAEEEQLNEQAERSRGVDPGENLLPRSNGGG